VPFAAIIRVVFEEVIMPWRLAQWEPRDPDHHESFAAEETVESGAWATTGRRPA
jgi:hypothetical protein